MQNKSDERLIISRCKQQRSQSESESNKNELYIASRSYPPKQNRFFDRLLIIRFSIVHRSTMFSAFSLSFNLHSNESRYEKENLTTCSHWYTKKEQGRQQGQKVVARGWAGAVYGWAGVSIRLIRNLYFSRFLLMLIISSHYYSSVHRTFL